MYQGTATTQINLCSGYGQFHSTSNKSNPQPYVDFNIDSIPEMVKAPQSIDKAKAQWLIPSTHFSRVYAEQRDIGIFYLQWADLDKLEGKTFDSVIEIIKSILPNTTAYIYNTKSATEDNPKCRVILPLLEPVDGQTYIMLQTLLNDQLEAQGIIPDRANQRAGQVLYLPNRGDYYRYEIIDAQPINPAKIWIDEQRAYHDGLIKRKAEQKQREQRAIEQVQSSTSNYTNVMEALKAEYPVETMLERCGYTPIGNKWLSPNSESGNPGVIVKDNRWISSHGSDSAIGIPFDGGTSGDAFDLFKFYFYGNDEKTALHEAGQLFKNENGKTIEKQNQINFAKAKALKELQTFLDSSDENWITERWTKHIIDNPKADSDPDTVNTMLMMVQSKTKQSISVLRFLLNTARQQQIAATNYNLKFIKKCASRQENEAGDAMMFHSLMDGNYLYDIQESKWFFWDGTCWTDENANPQKLFNQVIAQYKHYQSTLFPDLKNPKLEKEEIKQIKKQIDSISERISALNSITRRNRAIEMLLVNFDDFKVKTDHFNQDAGFIPFKNGMVNLKTGELLQHSKQNKIKNTFTLPFDYDEKLTSPSLHKVLMGQWEDAPEMIAFMQDLIAYCYSGFGNYQNIFPVFYGQGGEGKSILLNALINSLRPYTRNMKKQVILNKNFAESENSHTAHLETFRNKRLAPMFEVGRNDVLDIAKINALTGNDYLSVRRCNGSKDESIINTFTMVVTSNSAEPFEALAKEQASRDRIKIIVFPRKFRNTSHQDTTLKDKLNNEAQAIACDIVQFSKRLWQQQDGKLNIPESVELQTQRLIIQTNYMQDFIDEKLSIIPEGITTKKELYKSYLEFCSENFINIPLRKNDFITEFENFVLHKYKVKISEIRPDGTKRFITGWSIRP